MRTLLIKDTQLLNKKRRHKGQALKNVHYLQNLQKDSVYLSPTARQHKLLLEAAQNHTLKLSLNSDKFSSKFQKQLLV